MKQFARARGFTIVEVAVVIVVLSILVTLTAIVFNNIQMQSRDTARKSDVLSLKNAINRYMADNGEAPWPASGYTKGYGYDIGIVSSLLVPNYIKAIPTPPSANPYAYFRYTVSGSDPTVWSIEVRNETSPTCQIGNNPPSTWWSSAPLCGY